MCVCVCVCVYVCMYVCAVCVCACMHLRPCAHARNFCGYVSVHACVDRPMHIGPEYMCVYIKHTKQSPLSKLQ